MGGSDFGAGGGIEGSTLVLGINRAVAIEMETERSQRVILGFRRQAVFDRTFREVLDELNETTVPLPASVLDGIVPESYFDPRADLDLNISTRK